MPSSPVPLWAPALVALIAGCAAETPRPTASGLESTLRELEAAALQESAPAAERPAAPPPPHSSFSAFFDTHFASDAWTENVVEDYLTEPPILIPAGLGIAAVVVSFWDEEIQESLDGTWSSVSEIGDVGLVTLIAGAVLDGIVAPAPGRTVSDEMWTQGEAFALNLGLTESLKFITRRVRPNGVGGRSSFPSGHASTAFCAATLIERNAGLWLGISAYALAAATAYSRVESGKHFPSDVLAGAALGMVTASVIDALHFGRGTDPAHRGIAAPAVSVEPVEGEGGFLVGLTWRF